MVGLATNVLPPLLVAALAILSPLLGIVTRAVTGAKILTKWSANKLELRPAEQLYKYNKGPQWAEKSGFLIRTTRQDARHGTNIWFDLQVNNALSEIGATQVAKNADEARIPASIMQRPYDLPQPLRDRVSILLKGTNHKEGRKKAPIRFNGKLIRLATEPTVQQIKASTLELQKVTYFDGECSNETLRLNDELQKPKISPVEEFAFDRDLRIKALENSGTANIIGISIFAITSDGFVVFVRQTEGNSVSPGIFASSGSGSLEYKDYLRATKALPKNANKLDFVDLILNGMLRELREESGAQIEYIDWGSAFLTSYFRWISRAAKPEFTGIVRLNTTFAELKASKILGQEKNFTHNISSVPETVLLKCAHEFKKLLNQPKHNLTSAEFQEVANRVTELAVEALTNTHSRYSQKKASLSNPQMSPSCEFAWIAAALYFARKI